MKLNLYFIVLFYFLIACNSSNHTAKYQGNIDSLTIGPFKEGFTELTTKLQLNKNKTFTFQKFVYTDFIQTSVPHGSIFTVTGDYKRRCSRIILNPKTYKEIQDWGDSLVETGSGKYYKSDSTTIKKRFHIVIWSGKTFLLSAKQDFDYNDFVAFANNYNEGYDPNRNLLYLVKQDALKKATPLDLKQIPVKWRPYFLTSEVKIVVDKMSDQFLFDSLSKKYWYTYQLKGGIKNGVRKGMIFYSKRRCGELEITESSRLTSKGYVYLCPSRKSIYEVGDTLKASPRRFP